VEIGIKVISMPKSDVSYKSISK